MKNIILAALMVVALSGCATDKFDNAVVIKEFGGSAYASPIIKTIDIGLQGGGDGIGVFTKGDISGISVYYHTDKVEAGTMQQLNK